MSFAGVQLNAIRLAKEAMFSDGAFGEFLQKLGQNYGLPRSFFISSSDAGDVMYQQIVQLLAWQPKTAMSILYKLMEIVFGTQASYVSPARPWKVYEVNANEIIVEVPSALIQETNEDASYLHGIFGTDAATTSTSTFTTSVNILASAPLSALVGLTVSIINAGVAITGTITGVTWSGTQSTVTVSGTPFTNGLVGESWFIDIPGDNVISYRGDYLAPNANEASDTVSTTVHNDRVYVSGDGPLEIVKFYYNAYCRASGVVLRVEKI